MALHDKRVRTTTVEVDGETYTVRELTATELGRIRKLSQADDLAEMLAYAACRCVVDAETGKRVYTDADSAKLLDTPARLLQPILQAATSISKPDADSPN